jgi:SurA N-terminal domain
MDFTSISWWRNVFQKGGRAFGIGCALVFALPILLQAGFNMRGSKNTQGDASVTGTLCTVNGDAITQKDLATIPSESLGGTPGRTHASQYGGAIYSLVVHKVIEQKIKKLNVHASDADIDRMVAKQREALVGAKASDADWENYLSQRKNLTLAEFREQMVGQADVQALLDHYKAAEKVSPDDAKAQYSEIQAGIVYVASGASPNNPKAPPVSDADAAKKADDLHAKAVAGMDIKAILAGFGKDLAAQGAIKAMTEWRPEYQKGGQETPFGVLFYGPDFDKAMQKTAKGAVSDVVKTAGFQQGYVFGKVLDRRVNLPKDFDVKKEIAALQEQRAFKKLDAEVQAEVKAARVVFPADQVDKKAYFDYARLDVMQSQLRSSFGAPGPNSPTQAEFKTLQDQINSDFEEALKKHPEDATACLMVASNLQAKQFSAKPEEQGSIRDQLIKLYETAFKSFEDTDLRFTLADLYREKHDDKSAYAIYKKVDKLLNSDPPYDLATRQKQLTWRQRLAAGLKGLPANVAPDSATLAAAQDTKIAELQVRIKADQAKAAEDAKKQADAQKAADEAAKASKTGAAATSALPTGESSNAQVPMSTGGSPGTKR